MRHRVREGTSAAHLQATVLQTVVLSLSELSILMTNNEDSDFRIRERMPEVERQLLLQILGSFLKPAKHSSPNAF